MNFDLSIKIIRAIQKNPAQTQRALSKSCGVSIGSINFCIKALAKKGYVKLMNFRNARNRLAFAYILTPSGINLKKELTVTFLKRKQAEYNALKDEIKRLEDDLAQPASTKDPDSLPYSGV